MNADVQKQWVESLRSGDYSQTRGFLKTEKGYCCLGVLCDLYRKANTDSSRWEDRGEDGFDGGTPEEGILPYTATYRFTDNAGFQSRTDLPIDVRRWAGLGAHETTEAVMRLNDQGVAFADIADAIEAGACDVHPEHDA